MGKKEKRPDLNRVLIEEGKSVNPFASIVLKEKKEEKKKNIVLEKKKPNEIVKGYVPSLSFGDILDSYEKTGNPYSLPKKKASSPSSFGDILDEWENGGNKNKKKEKTTNTTTKSEYKATRSFASILSQYEGQFREKESKKQEKKAQDRSVNEILRSQPFFIEENDSDKPSKDAVWSIIGGKNPQYEKKEEDKTKVEEKKNTYKRVSEKYVAKESFSSILGEYEDSLKKKKEETKPLIKEEVKKEEIEIKEANFFIEPENGEKIPSNVSWSILGGKNENYVRHEEKKVEEKAPISKVKENVKRVSSEYKPKEDFASILATFDSAKAKEKSKEKTEKVTQEDKEVVLEENRFFIKDDEEKVPDNVSWSILGGKNKNYERKEEKIENVAKKSSDAKAAASLSEYKAQKSFSSILSSFEEKEPVKTFSEIIQEKGDNKKKKTFFSINDLRRMDPQSTLDLHGENKAESTELIQDFLDDSVSHGLRKVSIITGKGLHSETGSGVLRELTESILSSSPLVLETSSAPINKGGSGAIWIILKEKKTENE